MTRRSNCLSLLDDLYRQTKFLSNIITLLVKLEELNLTMSSCEETTTPLNQGII